MKPMCRVTFLAFLAFSCGLNMAPTYAAQAAAPSPTPGAISFDPVFTGPAVLQHGVPVAVYGKATPGALLKLSIGTTTTMRTQVTQHGDWQVTFPAQPVSWNVTLTASTSGSRSVDSVSSQVSFGMVILCSGQSNMAMPVGNKGQPKFHADNGTAECAASHQYTGKISLLSATESRFHHVPSWAPVSSKTLTGFQLCVGTLERTSLIGWKAECHLG